MPAPAALGWHTLTSPDDGTLALTIVTVLAWSAWAVMAASVLLEAVARARGRSAPSIPGLALPQRAVGQLVAVAALLFMAAPTVLAPFPAPGAVAAASPVPEAPRLKVIAPTAPVPTGTPPVPAEEAPVPAPEARANAPVPTNAVGKHGSPTVRYTVKRGDSLWKIAERLLGDGARYTEIVALNRDVLDGRPDFITPGTVLNVPHEHPTSDGGHTGEEYVVQPGDTLTQIAEEELGDPTGYREIFRASRPTVQPDGAHLSNPNLILPGWRLTIPSRPETTAPSPDRAAPPVDATPPVSVAPPAPPPVEPPPLESTPDRTARPPATSAPPVDDSEATSAESSPGWLLPGLTGAGAVLAGGVLLAVRAHRRTQLRYRRPGQTLAPPPPELATVEKTAHVSGAPLTDGIRQLDRALRVLADAAESSGRALPALVTVTLAGGTATLHLRAPSDLPAPWEGEATERSLRLDDSIPDADTIPPYPLLVTVGQDDAGRLHLVNLEELGSVTLTGDPDATSALARHIAAELALNPWSVLVQVDLVGVGAELTDLDTQRLRHHAAGAGVLDRIQADLESAEQAGFGNPDPYRVVITNSTPEAAGIVDVLSSARTRLGAAVVAVDAAPAPGSTAFQVGPDGRLQVERLGLDLVAAGLTGEEATACAAIVDLTRESPAVSMPRFTHATDGWRSLADQAGALREELTGVREDGPAGDGSLLPDAAENYIEVAATTAADVDVLAPVVPDQVRRTVEETDPTLDEDVAMWFAPDTALPRLWLLGPVRAYTRGDVVAVAKRRPYFVELLAFIALHPEGVSARTIAVAFGIGRSRARTDVGFVREWLGTNPRTGRLHLPRGDDPAVHDVAGSFGYRIEDSSSTSTSSAGCAPAARHGERRASPTSRRP